MAEDAQRVAEHDTYAIDPMGGVRRFVAKGSEIPAHWTVEDEPKAKDEPKKAKAKKA